MATDLAQVQKKLWDAAVESVAETGGKLRVLDITKPDVRDAIRSADSAKALYESNLATDY